MKKILLDYDKLKGLSPKEIGLLVHLLFNADENGVIVTSRRKLSEELEITDRATRTVIKNLHKLNLVRPRSDQEVTKKGTTITICNYESYSTQKNDGVQETSKKRPRTEIERPRNEVAKLTDSEIVRTAENSSAVQLTPFFLTRRDSFFRDSDSNLIDRVTSNDDVNNNINIYNNIYNSDGIEKLLVNREKLTHEEFIDKFLEKRIQLEQFCMSCYIDFNTLKRLVRQVVNEWNIVGKTHNTLNDANSHLLNSIRIKVKELKNNNNGNDRPSKEQRMQMYAQLIEDLRPKNNSRN